VAYTFSSRPIANTSDPALYLPCRYSTDFTYSIPAPAGNYNVNLLFAECFWSSAGKRMLNVDINGSRVLSSFDVFQAAGGANKAVIKSFPANSINGMITIRFTTAIS